MNNTAITHRHCEAPLGAVAISFPKYESYKDSSVEWLGDIPVGWRILPGMRCFYESKENNQGMIEDTVLSLSYGNIVIKPKEKLVGLVPESFETYQIVNQGDIIIRCTDLQNDQTSLRTGLANNRGIITSAYLNLRPFEHYDSRFIHYYLHALDLTKTLYRLGSGLRQNLSFNDFKRLPVPDITKPQQQAIVSFLDDKTAQIDEAISIKKKQIELLKEHKQILIQTAVTKGLDPNVKMKDSGVEWIGHVPEGWEVLANRYIFKLKKSQVGKNSNQFTLLSLTLNGVIKRDMENPEGKFPAEFDTYQPVKVGDFIFCLFDVEETPRTVGISPYDGMITGAYTVFEANAQYNHEYLHYLYYFLDKHKMMKSLYRGLRNTIPKDSFFSFKTITLPIKEQQAIVSFLDDKTVQIDESIAGQQKIIKKLLEYKASLINSAVTGKIKII